MTYFVKIPAKFRRGKAASRRMAPVWSFNTEVEAIDFAKSFECCWVEVSIDNKVIFKNYCDNPKWMSEGEAIVVREQNRQSNEDKRQEYAKTKRRGAV